MNIITQFWHKFRRYSFVFLWPQLARHFSTSCHVTKLLYMRCSNILLESEASEILWWRENGGLVLRISMAIVDFDVFWRGNHTKQNNQRFLIFIFWFSVRSDDWIYLISGFEHLMFVSNWLHQLLIKSPTLVRTAAVLQDFLMIWDRLSLKTLAQNSKWRASMEEKILRWIFKEDFPTSRQAKAPSHLARTATTLHLARVTGTCRKFIF